MAFSAKRLLPLKGDGILVVQQMSFVCQGLIGSKFKPSLPGKTPASILMLGPTVTHAMVALCCATLLLPVFYTALLVSLLAQPLSLRDGFCFLLFLTWLS